MLTIGWRHVVGENPVPGEYDLVIRGGLVVDGTGGVPFEADIGVVAHRIAAVGQHLRSGCHEIDARNHIVTPGFVDVHTHYDGQITWENRLSPSSNHGVTTVVMGNCGVGFAPVKSDQRELIIRLMEGVEDIPDVVMATGVPFNWQSFPEYLDVIERRPADVDFAAQLPHSPLRVYVMGKRGADLEPPTAADLAEMRRLACEAITAGAVGLSTSRSLNHRFKSGQLAPSVPSEESEVLALALGLRDAGAGVFQLLPNTAASGVEEFNLIRRIAEQSGRPVSFSLPTSDAQGAHWRDYVAGLEKASRDGLRITGQIYPRPIGVLFGLDLSFNPFSLNPSYRPIADLPLSGKVAALNDPALRTKLLAEEPQDANPFFLSVVNRTGTLFSLGDPPNYNPRHDDSIKARAARLGIGERELILEELLRDDGKAVLYSPGGGQTANGRFERANELFDKPGVILGLGDGGAHYGVICDAAYPTFLILEYVKKGSYQRRLTIERAVKMLTSEPAETWGFNDRGVLAAGYKADLNIIDLDRLHLSCPTVKFDLPAGGRRLTQHADGYKATVVSGQVTYRDGDATGALPGRLVRHARATPAHA